MIGKTAVHILLLVFFLKVCCYESDLETHEVSVDEGGDLLLPCGDETENLEQVYWVQEGRNEDKIKRSSIFSNGSLLLTHLTREDAGIYLCAVESQQKDGNDEYKSRVKVIVKTPPPRLVNVTVHPSTILALLRWDVEDTGGYPITHFSVQYRLTNTPPDQPPDSWHNVVPGHIGPSTTQIDVYQLEPNSTYLFQVWANNKLGPGEITQVEAVTRHDTQEIELGRHLLEGAENFDTRVWVAAVAVVMGTLVVLAVGTCYALYRECHIPMSKSV